MIQFTIKFAVVFLLLCITISFFTATDRLPIQPSISDQATDSGFLHNKLASLVNNSCQATPELCAATGRAFYDLGTHARNGLRVMYLFADKHFTNQPIEPPTADY